MVAVWCMWKDLYFQCVTRTAMRSQMSNSPYKMWTEVLHGRCTWRK